MRRIQDVTCPVCQADIPLSGDETPGSEIYCTYCGAPCLLRGDPETDDRIEAEEDF
jgi:DNA-directed RNA polymerase subunit RPC12/RpoP